MIKNNKKLVIFDFDGVILDSFQVAFSTLQKLNKKYNLFPINTREDFEKIYEGNAWKYYEDKGLIGQMKIDFLNEVKVEHTNRIRELKLIPGMSKVFKHLMKNCILTIISSNHSSTIKKLLENNKLDSYVSDILGVEMKGNKEDKINFLLDKYKVPLKYAYFVTDTSGDINEAKETKVKTVAVTWGFHSFNRLINVKPDYLVKNVDDLITVLHPNDD